jgi:hypothetical protein
MPLPFGPKLTLFDPGFFDRPFQPHGLAPDCGINCAFENDVREKAQVTDDVTFFVSGFV